MTSIRCDFCRKKTPIDQLFFWKVWNVCGKCYEKLIEREKAIKGENSRCD